MFCYYCGQNIKDNSSFCPYCGKILASKKVSTESAAVTSVGAAPNPNGVPRQRSLSKENQPNRNEVPVGSSNRQSQRSPSRGNQPDRKKSRWGFKLCLWLLALLVASSGVVFALAYFEIADIPFVSEFMTESGIIQNNEDTDEEPDEEPEEEPHKQNDAQDQAATEDTTTVEEETVPPATEDPEEAAYRDAVAYCSNLAEQGDFDSAIVYLEEIIQESSDSRYTDLCDEYKIMRRENIVAAASDLVSGGQYRRAIQTMDAAWKNYGDQEYYDAVVEYRQQFGIYNTSLFAVGKYNTVLLGSDGKVEICGDNTYGELAANSWTDMAAVSAGDRHIVGLTKNGQVMAVGDLANGQCNVTGWSDILAISAGDVHTVALAKDGTVYATGHNNMGQCNVSTLMNAAGDRRIVSVAAGYVHTLALLEDGNVVACGINSYGECNVFNWKDIVAIYAGTQFSAGLKMDGTVVVTGEGASGWDLSDWTDIVNLAAGDYYLIGLKADGTVVSVGDNSSDKPAEGQTNVFGLTDIVFVGAGNDHTVAMNSDGTLLCIGSNKYGQCNYHGRSLE